MKNSRGEPWAGLSNLAGLVLCGGESRRMGRDKGLLEKEGSSWAAYMGRKLTRWQLPVFYSINLRQSDTYGALFPTEQLILDIWGLSGPLEGLFSAHTRCPEKDWLLLACDMLDLDEGTIQGVIDAYLEKERSDFYVYRETTPERTFFQPFGGVYTSNGLAGASVVYRGGAGADLSLQSLLKKNRTRVLSLGRTEAFRNYNSL